MKKDLNALLIPVKDLADRLPRYARLISLHYARAQLLAMQVKEATINPEVLSHIYRDSISKVLQQEFGLSPEVAASESEFADFYVRHGILTNKLASMIFHIFIAPALPDADVAQCEEVLQRCIETLNPHSEKHSC